MIFRYKRKYVMFRWKPRITIRKGWVNISWLGVCAEWMTDRFNQVSIKLFEITKANKHGCNNTITSKKD